ncbi:MAG: hypothetical protein K0S08_21 [Gammaproteobacteria bacterium]|jgi:hypothetical protein|nr:hypothetical protein [Gammaproteobacteria bacterium]
MTKVEKSMILALPYELISLILFQLPLDDGMNFGNTCKRFSAFWQDHKQIVPRRGLKKIFSALSLSAEFQEDLISQGDISKIYFQYVQAKAPLEKLQHAPGDSLHQYHAQEVKFFRAFKGLSQRAFATDNVGLLLYLLTLAKDKTAQALPSITNPEDYQLNLLKYMFGDQGTRCQWLLHNNFHPICRTLKKTQSLLPYRFSRLETAARSLGLAASLLAIIVPPIFAFPRTEVHQDDVMGMILGSTGIVTGLISFIIILVTTIHLLKPNRSRLCLSYEPLTQLAQEINESNSIEQIKASGVGDVIDLKFLNVLALKLEGFFTELERKAIDLKQPDLKFHCSVIDANEVKIMLFQKGNCIYTAPLIFFAETDSPSIPLQKNFIPLCQIILNKYLFDLNPPQPSLAIETVPAVENDDIQVIIDEAAESLNEQAPFLRFSR